MRRLTITIPLLASALTAALAVARPIAPPTASYPPEEAYSLALHMHGSLSEQFGSWEWHTAMADSFGVDVVWWTDHDWRLTNFRHTRRYDFENSFWDADSGRWAEPDDAYALEFRYWHVDSTSVPVLQTALCDTLASEGQTSLRLETGGAPGPDFSSGWLAQTTSQVQHKYSLAKHPTVGFSLFAETLDPADARFVVDVELSDHPEGTHRLRYVVGSLDGEGIHTIGLPFTPGAWSTYTLDVIGDAISHFGAGGIDSLRAEDDNLANVRIGLETRQGSGAVVFFDDYRIDPDTTRTGDVLLQRGRAMASRYEQTWPSVTHFLGSEVSRFKAQPHLNAYAPDLQLVDYGTHVWSDSLYYAIDQIHAQDGAVALNHIFGTKFDHQADPDETPEHQASRLQWTKRWLIGTRAMGVDVLEVGYRRRGGMDLSHHLELWDALNANGVFLTGNGVTDSHGRGHWRLYGWGPYEGQLETIDNFVTWMFTEEFSEAGFVRSMKTGRAYFGDPYAWNGTADVRTLDGFRMGQVVYTDRDEHDLMLEVTNVPCDAEVRLVQAELRDAPTPAYLDVNYLRDEILPGSTPCPDFIVTVTIDTELSSVVRFEVRDGAGNDLVYGNPIHFVRWMPAAGIRAERVGVRLGEIRVFLGENFTLTGASLESGSGDLLLELDEDAPGAGTIRLDPGALGAPAYVAGATQWGITGGIVTLEGFSGEGSIVRVGWSGLGAPDAAGRLDRIELGPGRPNPFGRGTMIDWAIPAGGWARLEIVDVTGRRVRVLDLGFREAGRHRSAWDGTDESGRPTSAGIYYARLEHDGRTAVRKIARVR